MQDKFTLLFDENLFLAKKTLVENIYRAAKVEGVNTTFPETQTIIDGINVPGASLDDITTVLNLRDAYRLMLAEVAATSIDLEFISRINGEVARNQSLEWGKLRTGEIGIRGTDHHPAAPDPTATAKDITALLAGPVSASERAIDLMLYVMYHQLFWDGNKRTAIIVANAVLIRHGAGILTIPEEKIGIFNALLTDFYNNTAREPLKNFLYTDCISGLTR